MQFNSIVAGLLFAEQRLDGSIVDAGAREGHNACFYAVTAPTRTVHAIEPIRANYRIINKLYSGRSNLRPLLAGLGSAHGALDLVGGRPGAMLDMKKETGVWPPQGRQLGKNKESSKQRITNKS